MMRKKLGVVLGMICLGSIVAQAHSVTECIAAASAKLFACVEGWPIPPAQTPPPYYNKPEGDIEAGCALTSSPEKCLRAINLPADALERTPKEQLLALNQYSEVILYHAGRGNASLELYAQKLRAAGVTAKISFYQNGWMEWKNCGLPVQKQSE